MSLTEEEISYIADLMRRHAAIVFDSSKGYLIEARLNSLTRKTGHSSTSEVVQELRRGTWTPLHSQVVDALTTNETSFFRDYHPWESLANDILPDLIEARRPQRRLKIWCGASSSGQEPYTLAMLLRERFPQLADWRVTMLCTDISESMVRRTKEGSFSELEINRGIEPKVRDRWFDLRDGRWHARPELRSMIEATTLNLAGPWPAMGVVDLVLLRNVLIYFEAQSRRTVLERLRDVLAPDGFLMLGAAETTLNITNAFSRVVCGPTSFYSPVNPESTRGSVLMTGAVA